MMSETNRKKARELMTRAELMPPGGERDAMVRKAEDLARARTPSKGNRPQE